MKRILTVTGLFTFLTFSSFAQQGLHVEAFGGPQSTWLLNNADSDSGSIAYRSTTGMRVGASLKYMFSDHWGIGVGASYSVQGQRLEAILNDSISLGAFQDIDLNYIHFPIALRFESNPDNRFQYRAAFGPQLSFLLSANRTFTQTLFYDEVSADVKDEYNSVGFGLMLMQGVSYGLTKKINLFLDYRFDYSISDAENKSAAIEDLLNNSTTIYDPSRPKSHNATAGVYLGAAILLTK